MLQVGDKMPSFAAADETGKMVTNNDLIGKKTVLSRFSATRQPKCCKRLVHGVRKRITAKYLWARFARRSSLMKTAS